VPHIHFSNHHQVIKGMILGKISLATSRRRSLALVPSNYSNSNKKILYSPSQSMRLSTTAAFVTLMSSNSYSTTTALSSSGSNAAVKPSMLSSLQIDNSWPRLLSPETPENLQKSRQAERLSPDDDNRSKRPVFNGHYVLVKPTGLRDPELILWSKDVAHNVLKLTKEQVESPDFVQLVSGNLILGETWATPYALSIMGQRYTSNCPFGTGNGYGDGRAISIAEFAGHELQLKGAGKTPFARGADGRAVLRSSIREFLASEAMHFLGVGTTRALSLVKSAGQDTVMRPWYSPDAKLKLPEMDDPRLANYAPEERKKIIAQLRNTQKADPNMMIKESCAMTCRVASSFTRIGHLDLFGKRAEKASMVNAAKTDKRFDTSTNEWKELEELIWHACFREFKEEAYDPFIESKDLAGAATKLLELSADKISIMVANWLRVGFAQGNFNADNCLVSGKTMDYGPFGWIEEYSPLFAKWTGSGEHFGFLNQPSAGFTNYQVLVESVVPVIAAAKGMESPDELMDAFMSKAQDIFSTSVDEVFRLKLGLTKDADAADDLWESLKPLMQNSRVDWTLFWRQLSYVVREYPELESSDYDEMLTLLQGEGETSPFYEPLTPELRREWLEWLETWRNTLHASRLKGPDVYEQMRTVNPKFVLREWMLVDAYTSAADQDHAILNELHELIQHPYDEGSSSQVSEYYRRAPAAALATGGTAFMS
jgi:uncharacterized protein YdiU (UPF0061 family)